MTEINCYTDASYAKDVGGSFIGYKIADEPLEIKFLDGIKNTAAEVIAAETCILTAILRYPDQVINLYTDCQKVVDAGYHLSNVKIYKMVGHMKGTNDIHQTRFKVVDKATRKALRQRRKELILENQVLSG
jgi:hypothetical protein